MAQATIKNGVNVDDLITAVEAVKSDPKNGKLTFTVNSRWENGFKASHTTGGFVVGPEARLRKAAL